MITINFNGLKYFSRIATKTKYVLVHGNKKCTVGCLAIKKVRVGRVTLNTFFLWPYDKKRTEYFQAGRNMKQPIGAKVRNRRFQPHKLSK